MPSLYDRDPRGSKTTIQSKHVVGAVDGRLQDPDNIYVNIDIINESVNSRSVAQFQTTRTSSFVDNPNDYYLSVARFEIPNNSIPLFRFEDSPVPGEDSAYTITIVNGASSSRQVAVYPGPSREIYSVQQFIDIINTTIETACAAVVPPIVGLDIPYIYLDLNSKFQKIHFSDNANWLDGAPPATQLQLWMNWGLYYFFQTIQVEFSGQYEISTGPDAGKSYKILVKNDRNGNYVLGSGYEMSQETQLLSLYITIFSVIIATTTIPVRAELISVRGGSTTSASFNTISDFLPGQLANYSDNFTPYVYDPAFYRLIDLTSNSPLNKLDLQVYYTDINRNYSPLYLLPGEIANIKLVFVKKALFNNQYD